MTYFDNFYRDQRNFTLKMYLYCICCIHEKGGVAPYTVHQLGLALHAQEGRGSHHTHHTSMCWSSYIHKRGGGLTIHLTRAEVETASRRKEEGSHHTQHTSSGWRCMHKMGGGRTIHITRACVEVAASTRGEGVAPYTWHEQRLKPLHTLERRGSHN